MEHRPFGGTGHDVSVLGFGGAPVGFLETEQREVAKILSVLLDRGVNLVDTAAGYPGSAAAWKAKIRFQSYRMLMVTQPSRRACSRARSVPWS